MSNRQSLTLNKLLSLMLFWSLSPITMVISSLSMLLVVVERHLSATLLQLKSEEGEK